VQPWPDDLPLFAPVERCIYCGARERKLTDEHIVPYGLYGRSVLPAASCRECADIINREIEEPLMRGSLLAIRQFFNMPTRKRNKPRPTHQNVTLRTREGVERTVRVPIDKAPTYVFGFSLPVAGYLAGRPEVEEIYVRGEAVCTNPSVTREAAKAAEGEALKLLEIDQQAYMRFLAKIAHGFTVGFAGVDAFEHRLPPLILGRQAQGRSPNVSATHLIGWDYLPEEPFVADDMRMAYVPLLYGTGTVHTIRLRLFGRFGMPAYLIVAGPGVACSA